MTGEQSDRQRVTPALFRVSTMNSIVQHSKTRMQYQNSILLTMIRQAEMKAITGIREYSDD